MVTEIFVDGMCAVVGVGLERGRWWDSVASLSTSMLSFVSAGSLSYCDLSSWCPFIHWIFRGGGVHGGDP
jgi:hypothetical protein